MEIGDRVQIKYQLTGKMTGIITADAGNARYKGFDVRCDDGRQVYNIPLAYLKLASPTLSPDLPDQRSE